MPAAPLLKIEDAAAELGVPAASLRRAAEEHGYLVKMGRALRLERDRLGELIKKCRVQQREQGSTSSSTARTGTSATRANPTGQRAAQAATKLKKPSRPTSQREGGKVLPMSQGT